MPLGLLLKKYIAIEPGFLNVEVEDLQPGVAAGGFMASPEYKEHPMVGGVVFPLGLYCDGIQIGQPPHTDTLYAIYVTFLHLGTKRCTEMRSKHLWTMYRKSQLAPESVNQIWDVLLWELQALKDGCESQIGEMGKPLQLQEPGAKLAPDLQYDIHICLMQVRGDWAWYCEALGSWQWNSKAHMCYRLSRSFI